MLNYSEVHLVKSTMKEYARRTEREEINPHICFDRKKTGGCHPVVASPICELLYVCGLPGKGGELMMRDIPEFAHLKSFEEIFRKLEGDRARKHISGETLDTICAPYPLTTTQKDLLLLMLNEKGYEIE